jgi:hypothetical protein
MKTVYSSDSRILKNFFAQSKLSIIDASEAVWKVFLTVYRSLASNMEIRI